MNGRYSDIMDMPRPKSQKHRSMDAGDRAAQFSPFAALTGHGAAINETRRQTDKKIELSEDSLEELDRIMAVLREKVGTYPEISVEFFVKDRVKSGGFYYVRKGRLKRVDEYKRMLVFMDGARIPLDDIIEITEETRYK